MVKSLPCVKCYKHSHLHLCLTDEWLLPDAEPFCPTPQLQVTYYVLAIGHFETVSGMKKKPEFESHLLYSLAV